MVWLSVEFQKCSSYIKPKCGHLHITHRSIFAIGIKVFDQSKSSLITGLFPSEVLDHLIIKGFKGQIRSHSSLICEKISS